MLFLTEKRFGREWPSCVINCPVCDQLDATSKVTEIVTETSAYFLVNLFAQSQTYIVCGSCGAESISGVHPSKLEELTPDEIAASLRAPTTFIQKSLALIALCVCWFPMVGAVMCVITWFSNRRSRNWPRLVSKLALIVSAIVNIIFFSVMLIGLLIGRK